MLNYIFIFAESFGRAVVPSAIIYAGETLNDARLKEYDVTNSKLRGNYARSTKDVVGLVTQRTLLPGQVIPISALRLPYVITNGSKIRIIFEQGNMIISSSGIALADARVGDVILVKNIDTSVIISGSAMSDGTIRVSIK
ncbi:flagellar basal body P-ring formation chaperone FlgA [Candidatus Liberibacter sp.]|uniref:flagellar basal body P-ring formation chaperone FlgA n=1 Tax=Candidatus Liberibacter sp. TaxID=34022 RepID=UPI0021755322|nr:flagellar basal body P-ring formation chaperone FlgA [Candidatus Liberibacter sp.]